MRRNSFYLFIHVLLSQVSRLISQLLVCPILRLREPAAVGLRSSFVALRPSWRLPTKKKSDAHEPCLPEVLVELLLVGIVAAGPQAPSFPTRRLSEHCCSLVAFPHLAKPAFVH